MYRQIFPRCIVQRNNDSKDKYEPAIVTASCSHSYPFSVPAGTVEIVTNTQSGTRGFTSPIRADDILRLQVAIKTNPRQKLVYQELFSGRIRTIRGRYGSSGNTTFLECVGHMEEAEWTMIESDESITSSQTVGYLLNYFITTKGYKRLLKYSDTYVQPGISLPSYSTTAYQTYMSDLFSECEKVSGSDWFIDSIPVYDDDNNLTNVYITWKPFAEEPTEEYAIIEGTDRFIEDDFQSSIEELLTYYRAYGNQPTAKVPQINVSAAYSDTYSNNWSDTATVSLSNGSFSSSAMSVWIDPGAAAHYQSVGGGTINISGSSSAAVSGSISGTVSGNATQTIATQDVTLQNKKIGEKISEAALQAQYGKRGLVETYDWIKTDSQCLAIATGVLTDRARAQRAGRVKIIGTPKAHIGDYVYCKLPSIEVDGQIIDGYYSVYGVSHNLTATEFNTELDLGRKIRNPWDYIGLLSTVAKTTKKNQCKSK